ncbi:bis-aminopropyl spermidine synthase family protein [Paenibacillus thiaminolyticus]|nr:bis-aminopropyl spermidine synthase family protein [Paenibacillus thiaminolyticus]
MKALVSDLYEHFARLDEEELEKYERLKQKNKVIDLWNKWHRIHRSPFEKWLWKSCGTAVHLQDLINMTGTLHLALRLLEVCRHAGLVDIQGDGALQWKQPFASWRSRSPARINDSELRKVNEGRYGQFRADWTSSELRAHIIHEEIPSTQRIFFCGDDDYSSVALALYGERDITVGDVDPEVLQRIDSVAEAHHLTMDTLRFDVEQPAPSDLIGRFHAFHCDPLDSGKGLGLWLLRADELLSGEVGDTLFINVSIERLGARVSYFQQYLMGKGFCLDRIYRNANNYPLSEEPFINRAALQQKLNRLELHSLALDTLFIHTDMLVFIRTTDELPLFPQEFIEFRREI